MSTRCDFTFGDKCHIPLKPDSNAVIVDYSEYENTVMLIEKDELYIACWSANDIAKGWRTEQEDAA